MAQKHLTTPCPDCGTPILFEPKMLLTGVKFTCTRCSASIGLATESVPVVRESLDKFDKLKSRVLTAPKPA